MPAGQRQRILILDGHSKAAAETLLALPRDCEFHVAATSGDALAFASRRTALRLQQPEDPQTLAAWLIERNAQAGYALIVPSTEASLLALKRQTLPAALRSRAVLAAEDAIDTALSKEATTRLAQSLGIPVPRSRRIDGLDSAERSAAQTFPTVIKPLHSKVMVDGRLLTLQARICRTPSERTAALRELLPSTSVIEQEYFAGRGVGVELLFEHGQLRWLFAHERLHEMPLTGGASTYRRAAYDTPRAVRESAVRLLERLHWHGVAMVEFKVRADGDYRLIEVNPRLWGSLPLAVACGVNFPLGLLRMASGADPGPQPAPTRCRYARDAAADLRWALQSWRRRGDPLLVKPLRADDILGWLRPLLGRERWDLFRWSERELWWTHSIQTLGTLRQRLSSVRQRRRAARAAAAAWRSLQGPWAQGHTRTVLVLCYGNICRSPVVAALLQRALPDVDVTSAGFHERTGRSSPGVWADVVRSALGIDLDRHRSQAVDAKMIERADLIIAMDADNWQRLAQAHPQALDRSTLLPIAGGENGSAATGVPDPYGQPEEQMKAVAEMLGRYTRQLVALRTRPPQQDAQSTPV